MIKAILILIAILLPNFAQAKVLFEAYYKIEENDQHVGYAVQRHSLNEKNGERELSYFFYKKGEVVVREGAKTVSTTDFRPLRYSTYEWTPKGDSEVIEGSFNNKTFTWEAFELDGKKRGPSIQKGNPVKVPEQTMMGTIVSQFMAIAIPNLYKPGFHRQFITVDEVENEIDTIEVKYLRDHQGFAHLWAKMPNDDFEAVTSSSGEQIATRNSKVRNITYAVATREEALGDFPLAKDQITLIFKDIPHGAEGNPVAAAKLNMKEILKSLPHMNDKDRQPNSKAAPKLIEFPPAKN